MQGLAQYRAGRQWSDPGPGTVIHQGSPSLGRPSLVCQEAQDLCQEPPHPWAHMPPLRAAGMPGDVVASLEPRRCHQAWSLLWLLRPWGIRGAVPMATSVVLSLGKSHPLGTLGGRAELYRTPGLLGHGC